jgi:hypothetical protein
VTGLSATLAIDEAVLRPAKKLLGAADRCFILISDDRDKRQHEIGRSGCPHRRLLIGCCPPAKIC